MFGSSIDSPGSLAVLFWPPPGLPNGDTVGLAGAKQGVGEGMKWRWLRSPPGVALNDDAS